MNRKVNNFGKLFSFFLLPGCGWGANKDTVVTRTFPARVQCQQGKAVASQGYDAVTFLFLSEVNKVGKCTGFFVSEKTLLTAAHCVANTASGNVIVMLDNCDAGETSFFENGRVWHSGRAKEDYDGSLDAKLVAADLAVVSFSQPISSSYLQLPSALPTETSVFEVVGFGEEEGAQKEKQEFSVREIKKKKNIISVVNLDFALKREVILASSEENSASKLLVKGDSGGPLLVDRKPIGVASAGSETTSFWAFLGTDQNLRLMNKAASEGAKISGLGNFAKLMSSVSSEQVKLLTNLQRNETPGSREISAVDMALEVLARCPPRSENCGFLR